MKTIIIACDPGKSGGIAVLHPDNSVTADKMPDTVKDLSDYLITLQTNATVENVTIKAYVEEVGGYVGGGGQPGSAMFRFGFNVGTIHGILTVLGIPFETIRPQKWQKEFGLGTVKSNGGKSHWKRRLKETAQRLYPQTNPTLNTSDALLILRWASRRHE